MIFIVRWISAQEATGPDIITNALDGVGVGTLRISIIHIVPRSRAASLEDVEQPEPVARLVHGDLALVVAPVVGAVGHRRGVHETPVYGLVEIRGLRRAVGGPGAEAPWPRRPARSFVAGPDCQVGDVEQVQIGVGALPESLFDDGLDVVSLVDGGESLVDDPLSFCEL